MPAHIKASLLGPSLSLPVRDGRLALGTWQGVYLCEHRDHGGPRSLLATLHGDAPADGRAGSRAALRQPARRRAPCNWSDEYRLGVRCIVHGGGFPTR